MIISYLFYLYLNSTAGGDQTHYRVGQIADRDIIAPFSFQVLKDSETLAQERERIAESIEPVYKVDADITFNTIRKIDSFIEHLSILEQDLEIETIQSKLINNGYYLSRESIELLSDSDVRLQLHNYLINIFDRIMSVGIYGYNIDEENILLSDNNLYRRLPLSRLYGIEESIDRIVGNSPNEKFIGVLEEIVSFILSANIVIDSDKTNALIQEQVDEISPILTEVLENEEIIRKNRRITEMDLKKLETMYSYTENDGIVYNLRIVILSVIGYFLFSLLLLSAGVMLFSQMVKERFNSYNYLITYLGLIIFLITLTFSVTQIEYTPPMLLPFALVVIIFAFIFSPICGIIFNLICLFLVLPFFQWDIITLMILFISTFVLLVIMTKMNDFHDFFPLTIYCLFSFLIILSIISLLTQISTPEFLNYLFYGSLSSILAITGVILFSPFIEKKLNLTNKIILLQLLETDNPLLKRMALEAPGTFHHSITVGILAESAAEAIGANGLLARVASYYHDIGKLTNPDMFIENNSTAPEYYEKMDCYKSTVTIRNHVLSGITLAKKHKLPQQVINIIRQHHGVNKVSYFYEKVKEINPDEDEKKYRYFGPKPRTKEAALVMIADIVESTAKANRYEHTEESLKKIIDSTVTNLINDNQLSEAPITLKELETIKSFMHPIILGIYRKRFDYPKENNDKTLEKITQNVSKTPDNLESSNLDQNKTSIKGDNNPEQN